MLKVRAGLAAQAALAQAVLVQVQV